MEFDLPEMMAVKNMHREYTGVSESMSEAFYHHESSLAATNRQGGDVHKMVEFIEERGHHSQQIVPQSFTTSSPIMSEEIRKDVQNASEKAK